LYSGNAVFPFTVTFSNGTTKTNTTGNFLFFNFTNGNYSYTATAANKIVITQNVEVINSSFVTLQFLPDNKIVINFKNEENRSKITRVAYEIENPSYAGNFSTKNGTATLTGLPLGRIKVTYTGLSNSTLVNPWNTRNYYFFIPLSSTTQANVTLYLLNASRATYLLSTVTNENQNPIDDSYLQVLRYYVQSNSYEPVEMAEPDFLGIAPTNLVFNSVFYKFRVYRNDTLLYETPTPSKLFSTEQFITVTTNTPITTNCGLTNGFYGNVTNSSTSFTFSYNAALSTFSQSCLSVVSLVGAQQITNKTCNTNAQAQILISGFNFSKTGTYQATGYIINANGQTCTLSSLSITGTDENPNFSAFGLFLILIMLLVSITLFSFSPVMSVSLTLLTLIIGGVSALGFLVVPWYVITTFIVLGIGILLWGER
jgi:uncharacterized membrane protein